MTSKNYDEFLVSQLRDPELAAEYLTAAVEDGSSEQLMIALRNVAEAHGGVAVLAEIAHLNRQSMYKMLSPSGNPTLATLLSLLDPLGIRLAFTPAERQGV